MAEAESSGQRQGEVKRSWGRTSMAVGLTWEPKRGPSQTWGGRGGVGASEIHVWLLLAAGAAAEEGSCDPGQAPGPLGTSMSVR